MSADVIDINGPREERRFKEKESRLKQLRDAFKAARLDAQEAKKKAHSGEAARISSKTSSGNKKKGKKPTR
jgi:hypothetical protein